MITVGVTLTVAANEKRLLAGLDVMSKRRVMVGFPATSSSRTGTTGGATQVTNAMLGYIHDQGSPRQNIPQREFLVPGIKSDEASIMSRLAMAGDSALDGDKAGVDAHLSEAGIKAVSAVRKKITSGPFTPLKPATLKARKRRGFMGTKPLIVTHQLSNAVNYVVRTVQGESLPVSRGEKLPNASPVKEEGFEEAVEVAAEV